MIHFLFLSLWPLLGMLMLSRRASSFNMIALQRRPGSSVWRQRRLLATPSDALDHLANALDTPPGQVDWNDRVGMQAAWSHRDKGWHVEVEWRPTAWGAGLFAAQDIARGTRLRTGRHGANLVQFRSVDDIEAFCRGRRGGAVAATEEEFDAKLHYVKDYMWVSAQQQKEGSQEQDAGALFENSPRS